MPSWSTFWPNRPKMHVAGFTLTPSDWYRRLMNVEAGWGIWTAWVLVLNRHILKHGTHWRPSWIQQSQLYRQQSWPYRQHSWTGRQHSRPRQDVEFTLLLICCQNRHQSWTYMATVNFVAGFKFVASVYQASHHITASAGSYCGWSESCSAGRSCWSATESGRSSRRSYTDFDSRVYCRGSYHQRPVWTEWGCFCRAPLGRLLTFYVCYSSVSSVTLW